MFLTTLFAFFVFVVLVSAAAPLGWPMDLVSHFHIQFAAAALVFVCCFCWRKAWNRSVVAVLCFSFSAWQIAVPTLFQQAVKADAPRDPQISIVAANLFGNPESLEGITQLYRSAPFSIAVLTELPRGAIAGDFALARHLPHIAGELLYAAPGRPGAVILSAWPAEEADMFQVGRNPAAVVKARYCPNEMPSCLTVLALHTPPPFLAGYFARQKAIFSRLSAVLDRIEGPIIVAGDLNATPWSEQLRKLTSDQDLKRVPCGGRVSPTWLSTTPGLGLPLDHILLRGPITYTSCDLAPFSGSDHVPVLGSFVLQ